MSDRKAVIKNADMSEEMQQDSVECATQALEKYNIEKDIAAHIKKEWYVMYRPSSPYPRPFLRPPSTPPKKNHSATAVPQ
uniref:Dynein light chain n=1 Tax=Vombatus ursinus TaxID=29139 RepID=A0A4X2LKV0_VOMUR